MRKFALIALKFAVSAILLYLATRRVNIGIVGERLNRLDTGWMLGAVAIACLQVGLVTVRWQRIVEICGAPLPLLQALRFNMVATFFSQVLPSTVGGDAVRVWLLARTGAGWAKATYSVLLDRFVGVLVLAALVAIGLFRSLELIQSAAGRLVLLVIGLGSLAGGAVFLLLSYWPPLTRWKATRPLAELSGLGRQVLFSRRSSLAILLTSVIIHLSTALVAWMIGRAVAVQLGYVDALVLVLPVLLIATIPVSIAGWGVRESALVLAFSYAGLPPGDGLVMSVLLGLVQFAVGVIGGAVWLASPDNRQISMWSLEPPPQP